MSPTLFPAPLRETPAQTACRIKRRLRDRWPAAAFSVRSDRKTQTVTVAWRGGPTTDQVDVVTAPHDRSAGTTLWASPRGHLSLVEPQARVELRHERNS